ncbi:MAG: hypothetical protein Q3976_05800 [Corynebacterium sp.]|nr:hypothetical protein [Corynebacterium sp.]
MAHPIPRDPRSPVVDLDAAGALLAQLRAQKTACLAAEIEVYQAEHEVLQAVLQGNTLPDITDVLAANDEIHIPKTEEENNGAENASGR